MNNLEFIQKAKEIHGNSLDFSKTQFDGNWSSKVVATCPIHGDIEVTAKHLIYSKVGCKQCSFDKQRIDLHEAISAIKEIHGDKYDYSKVVYNNNRTPITLICPIHGEFEITLNSIKRQHAGCPQCAIESIKNKLSDDFISFKEKAERIHGNRYSYIDENYVNNKTPISVQCNICQTIFQVRPDNHLFRKSGCPHCQASHLEIEVENILKESNIEFVYQKRFDWLNPMSLDFYLPQYNIAIECQGEQHFRPVDFGGEGELIAVDNFNKLLERDKKKLSLCHEHGIEIVYYYKD